MLIRKAERKDLEELLEIYNDEVINGVATLDLNPKTMQEWEQWFFEHNIDNHPLIVAELDNRVAGYASLSTYREKEAYCSTVELSVYVASAFQGLGVGTKLLQSILEEARKDENTHVVVSVITAGNEVSRKLHEKFGFTYSGTLHKVGYKMGAYRDIDNFEIRV
ncbi:MAG: N-acetyltransferase [Lachnospiraceae bacterium]|nr:N-acetyltransferase [Lachnospiraceae bacterium]